MAGKPGMHTKPLHVARVNEMREKIKATLIIKKLEGHILNDNELKPSQVNAALGLLKKVVPDLTSMELSNKDDVPLKLDHVVMTAEEAYKKLINGDK
jgi:hypothetical protein